MRSRNLGSTRTIPTRDFARPLSISQINEEPRSTSFSLNQTVTPRDSSKSCSSLERVSPDRFLDFHCDASVIPCLEADIGRRIWANHILLSCVNVPCGLSSRVTRTPKRRGSCVCRSSSSTISAFQARDRVACTEAPGRGRPAPHPDRQTPALHGQASMARHLERLAFIDETSAKTNMATQVRQLIT